MLRETERESAAGEVTDLSEIASSLGKARQALRDIETTALAAVAESLAHTAESLERTVRRLEDAQSEEWMTPERAARYFGCASVAAFERVVAKEEIPKHYLSDRLPRYARSELDAWLKHR